VKPGEVATLVFIVSISCHRYTHTHIYILYRHVILSRVRHACMRHHCDLIYFRVRPTTTHSCPTYLSLSRCRLRLSSQIFQPTRKLSICLLQYDYKIYCMLRLAPGKRDHLVFMYATRTWIYPLVQTCDELMITMTFYVPNFEYVTKLLLHLLYYTHR